jgi:hypothetical protein
VCGDRVDTPLTGAVAVFPPASERRLSTGMSNQFLDGT